MVLSTFGVAYKQLLDKLLVQLIPIPISADAERTRERKANGHQHKTAIGVAPRRSLDMDGGSAWPGNDPSLKSGLGQGNSIESPGSPNHPIQMLVFPTHSAEDIRSGRLSSKRAPNAIDRVSALGIISLRDSGVQTSRLNKRKNIQLNSVVITQSSKHDQSTTGKAKQMYVQSLRPISYLEGERSAAPKIVRWVSNLHSVRKLQQSWAARERATSYRIELCLENVIFCVVHYLNEERKKRRNPAKKISRGGSF